jgi:hypothetical protein
MLEKEKNKVLPCGRNSMGALDSALSSIPFGVCVSPFFAAASSFVQDNIGNFQKKVCHNHCLADFFDPTRYPKR